MTPQRAHTTTSPAGPLSWGNETRKKDLPAIAVAHGAIYITISSSGYQTDIASKVKKALGLTGPKYLQIHCPFVHGWGIDSKMTIRVARAALASGLYPLFEIEYGELAAARKIKEKELLPVEEYLSLQKMFSHTFKTLEEESLLAEIQEIANENIRKYQLLKKTWFQRRSAAFPIERFFRKRVFKCGLERAFGLNKGVLNYNI